MNCRNHVIAVDSVLKDLKLANQMANELLAHVFLLSLFRLHVEIISKARDFGNYGITRKIAEPPKKLSESDFTSQRTSFREGSGGRDQ